MNGGGSISSAIRTLHRDIDLLADKAKRISNTRPVDEDSPRVLTVDGFVEELKRANRISYVNRT